MLETLIANHCGPALAGIKSASTVTVFNDKIMNLDEKISRLNHELNKKDIYIKVMCRCSKSTLLMVYREKTLSRRLNDKEIKKFLSSLGYASANTVEEYLDILSKRLSKGKFPHEIGAFLGYPINDIYAFINHRDTGCLMIGVWRVYSDKEVASKIFERYRKCTGAILCRLNRGQSLAQIFCT